MILYGAQIDNPHWSGTLTVKATFDLPTLPGIDIAYDHGAASIFGFCRRCLTWQAMPAQLAAQFPDAYTAHEPRRRRRRARRRLKRRARRELRALKWEHFSCRMGPGA